MQVFQRALEALASPKNEPLNWLLGDVLREQAQSAKSKFLLEALGAEPRSGALTSWNAYIDQYRELLVNPADSVKKAARDVKAGKNDAGEKLLALAAEIMAVVHLRELGYAEFRVLMPTGKSTPDFEARLGQQKALIEVKNLREPQDILRTVAVQHWNDLRSRNPKRYNFRIVLRHAHRGQLSLAAQKRLRTILDQLPDRTASVVSEDIDNGIQVRIERLKDNSKPQLAPEAIFFDLFTNRSKPNGMLLVSGITEEHLTIGSSEIQSLFLKAIRPIAGALDKFFGDAFDPVSLNVIALRWEPPDFLVAPEMLSYVTEKIEGLFDSFGLQLKPIIFCEPLIPLELLQRYR